jgi:shikimate dehydrogenase
MSGSLSGNAGASGGLPAARDVGTHLRQDILLGLIGAPIRQSASPAIHEAAGRALGLRLFYHLIEVPQAGRARLRAMLEGVRCLGFAGVNVTYPYKEAVVPLLDEVAPEAASIGSVNTIVARRERLVGYNTDASGFARACNRGLGPIVAHRVALVGAGGVGKAIAFALVAIGAGEVRIVDRDVGKAAALAAVLAPRAAARACVSLEDALTGADGLVNATPVGMLPDRGTPVPVSLLRPDLWVADVVYSPLWTPLLVAARDCGARIMTGRELTIEQALDAFRLFTGAEAPRDVMAAAFDAAIAARTTTTCDA